LPTLALVALLRSAFRRVWHRHTWGQPWECPVSGVFIQDCQSCTSQREEPR
jgi:hypothetical protein